jgi:hypothetical protein
MHQTLFGGLFSMMVSTLMCVYVAITWKKLLLREQITVFSTNYMMDADATATVSTLLHETKVGMINQIADNNGKRIPYDDEVK